jgi:HEPN domain-containing protein
MSTVPSSIAITTKMNLNAIQKKANEAKMEYALAYYDFLESIKDTNYVICNQSKEILTKYALLDPNNEYKIYQSIRELYSKK